MDNSEAFWGVCSQVGLPDDQLGRRYYRSVHGQGEWVVAVDSIVGLIHNEYEMAERDYGVDRFDINYNSIRWVHPPDQTGMLIYSVTVLWRDRNGYGFIPGLILFSKASDAPTVWATQAGSPAFAEAYARTGDNLNFQPWQWEQPFTALYRPLVEV